MIIRYPDSSNSSKLSVPPTTHTAFAPSRPLQVLPTSHDASSEALLIFGSSLATIRVRSKGVGVIQKPLVMPFWLEL